MLRRKGMSVLVIGVLSATLLAACSSGSGSSTGNSTTGSAFQGVPLTGAGATFPDPIYEQWFKDYHSVATGAQINYQAIGSGGGVEQMTKQTVDFGASDAPLQKDQISALPSDVVEIPTVLGGVVFGYNVPGLQSGLKLDGTTAADIFLGKISNWNDPALANLNPDMTLPNLPIQVVHRSDESGTTFVFTSWLAGESKDWQKAVGADTAVQWPTGSGADGNDGVAAGISQTKGAIGYVSYDFAVASHLGIADVRRDDGTYITPSVDSITAAGGILKFPIAPDTNILNSSAPGAYPISTTTYLLIYANQTDKDKGQTIVDFVHWALTQGQPTAAKLNYAPLPQDIAQQALAQLSNVTYQGKPIQPSM
ncbi:MAG: phosphate ABC transporter substrate-binding protein PstS [Actinomycetota bacterium]|nr:phosphate ABC transporter substrate-binding protein PstS [Actinomycetota bacterium]